MFRRNRCTSPAHRKLGMQLVDLALEILIRKIRLPQSTLHL
jgi:hypothetical protein